MGLDAHLPNHVLGGRYRLVTRVGQGGFGDVWRAVELFSDGTPFRDVALKLLAPELAGASWAEEAKLLASFSHPSLVTIFAAGILSETNTPFVAMEFLEGETLAEVLKRRRSLGWRAALRIARDVAAALDVIHLRGIVHLDLKPANLFLTTAGKIKVLDFGLSRQEGDRARAVVGRRMADDASLATGVFYDSSSDPFAATQAVDEGKRAVAGTPGFVAPEVLEMLEPTGAADAYALGATIVQLVTGRLPHKVGEEPRDASNPETVRSWWLDVRDATLRGSLRDLEHDGLPSGMAGLTRRFLSVDPASRGCPPGSLFRQLDEVWARPFGVQKQPYAGLSPFGPEREGTLFGRDAETQRLARDLSFEPVLVLSGPRGGGKTSLVLAGVVPELAKSGADGKEDWRAVLVDPARGERVRDIVESMRPSPRADLLPVLALSATESLDGASPRRGRSVAPTGAPDAEALALPETDAAPSTLPASDLATAIHDIANGETGVVVVFDPLEALLRLGDSERRALVELIQVLAHTPRGKGIRLVATLDEHEAARVVELCGFDATIRAGFRFVGEPQQADALEIATAPARLAGVKIDEPEIVCRDVEDALKRPGLLPFVSLALARFWDDAKQKGAALVGARYREMGGTKAAIVAHADATLSALDRDRRTKTTELLLHLSSTEGKLSPRTVADLGAELGDASAAEQIARDLVEAHLLVWQGERVRLVDERLITWAPLETARLDAMERLALRERLREAADAWDRSGQRREYLVTGGLLRAATSGEVKGLSPLESDFVRECRKALRRRQLALVTVVAAVCALAAGLWFGERVLERRRAEAERLQKKAQDEAYLAGVIAKANRSDYRRYEKVALLVEAISKGSTDPSLPVELFEAANRLAPARFLTLESLRDVDFDWNARWIVGKGRLGSIVAIDLEPPKGETEVVEDADIDAAAKRGGLVRKPRITELMPTDDPTVQIAPFPFDTAMVTRSAGGELRVIRLREDGGVALVAVPPLACRGDVKVARRGAVLACPTERGVAVWSMKAGSRRDEAFAATGVALSSDGAFAAAWSESSVLLLDVASGKSLHVDAPTKVALATFSPKEPLVALVTARGFDVVDARTGQLVFRHDGATFGKGDDPHPPAAARWDDGGVDLSLCDHHGEAVSYYLRRGARASADPLPRIGCDDRLPAAPKLIRDRNGFGRLSEKEAGDHFASGGFKLGHDRYVTRSLVVLSADDDTLDRAILFEERKSDGSPASRGEADTFVDVIRSGDSVAVEEPSEIVVLQADNGARKQTLPGAHLLGPCADGRVAAYSIERDHYKVFDVKSATELGGVAREPGLVAGISPTCDKLYIERLDGTLVRHLLGVGDDAKELSKLSGYVFDRKPSAADPADAATHAGLVLAVSGGAILRVDAVDDTVRVVGAAVPYASAIADGPQPLETVFADSTGVSIARRSGAVERVLQGNGERVFEDIAVSRGRDALLLGAPDQLSVLNLALGEVVVSSERDQVTRFAPWDRDGSFVAWSPHIEGSPRGFIIPGSVQLAQRIGSLASNLRVNDGRIVLRE